MQRTAFAWRQLKARGILTPEMKARIERRPDITVDLPSNRESAVLEVSERLRQAGLKTRTGKSAGYAESGVIGLFGSPVFHWSLAVFILVAALGQLTRWEGLVAVTKNSTVLESAESYGRLDPAPFALPHTGWEIGLVSVNERKVTDGIDYGWTPTVSVTDGSGRRIVKATHANRPIRRGPLLIHYIDHGLAAVMRVEDGSGGVLGSTTVVLDFVDTTPSGTTTGVVEYESADGTSTRVQVTIDARDRRGDLPRLRPPVPSALVFDEGGPEGTAAQRMKVGEAVRLSDGRMLRLAEVGDYARLSVVRDWSVWWLYALMGIATLALALTLFVPHRSVWFVASEHEGMTRVSLVARESRHSELFKRAVSEAARGVSGSDFEAL